MLRARADRIRPLGHGASNPVPSTQCARRSDLSDCPGEASAATDALGRGDLSRSPRPRGAPLSGRDPCLRLSGQPLPSPPHRRRCPASGSIRGLSQLESRSRSRTDRRMAREVLGAPLSGGRRFGRRTGASRAVAVHPSARLQGESRSTTSRLARCKLRRSVADRCRCCRKLGRSVRTL